MSENISFESRKGIINDHQENDDKSTGVYTYEDDENTEEENNDTYQNDDSREINNKTKEQSKKINYEIDITEEEQTNEIIITDEKKVQETENNKNNIEELIADITKINPRIRTKPTIYGAANFLK